jgi:hypothetical protein
MLINEYGLSSSSPNTFNKDCCISRLIQLLSSVSVLSIKFISLQIWYSVNEKLHVCGGMGGRVYWEGGRGVRGQVVAQ